MTLFFNSATWYYRDALLSPLTESATEGVISDDDLPPCWSCVLSSKKYVWSSPLPLAWINSSRGRNQRFFPAPANKSAVSCEMRMCPGTPCANERKSRRPMWVSYGSKLGQIKQSCFDAWAHVVYVHYVPYEQRYSSYHQIAGTESALHYIMNNNIRKWKKVSVTRSKLNRLRSQCRQNQPRYLPKNTCRHRTGLKRRPSSIVVSWRKLVQIGWTPS